MADELPDLTAFRAWLVPQPLTRAIGQRQLCTACPLATWLRAYYGVPVSLDDELVVLDYSPTGLEQYPTPALYKEVVGWVDFAGGAGHPVTVGECLRILHEVLADAEEGA